MSDALPALYLIVLLVLLGVAAWAIGREVLKRRRTESRLSQLQNKLTQQQGEPHEYYELGSIYISKKLYVQAAKVFQRALKGIQNSESEVAPENVALIYNGLGFAYFAQEQYDLAIRQYKEALERYPEYAIARNNLAHAYERKQLDSQALEAYEQNLQYDPNNKTARHRAESLRKRTLASQ